MSDDLMKELLGVFREEAREHLATANRLLVELESNDQPGPGKSALVTELFRSIHSLKGAARAVNLPDVETTAHRLESVLGALREGGRQLSKDGFDTVYAAIDAIARSVAHGLGDDDQKVDATHTNEKLDSLLAELQVRDEDRSKPTPEPKPSPEPTAPAAMHSTPSSQTSPERTDFKPEQDGDETIRIAASKLDRLLAHAGELVSAKIGMEQRLEDAREVLHLLNEDSDPQGNKSSGTARFRTFSRDLARDTSRLALVTKNLQEEVRSLRMIPIGYLFGSLPRTVRDVAHALGKDAAVSFEGSDLEVDKRIIEEIKDPLNHLLRNAVDHGIEPPEARRSTGKPPTGQIVVRAVQQGSQLILEVSDDGAGVDTGAVRTRAESVRGATEDALSEDEVLDLIFASGLSTKREVSDLSGRGVGLDVVRANVGKLHGRVQVSSTPGQGTTIRMVVPLTVSTSEALLVKAGEQRLAFPITAVERILRVASSDLQHIEGRLAVSLDGRPVIVADLAAILGLTTTHRNEGRETIAIVAVAEKRVGLILDVLIGQQEIVVKTLGKLLQRVRNIAGATILGSGEVVPVLNPADLVASAMLSTNQPAAAGRRLDSHSVLVVDDSVTTRTLQRTVLESAGFSVRTAVDGQEAWNLLQVHPFDVVVTDLTMPRISGLELTRLIKTNPTTNATPVVVVTSLDSEEDKKRGMEAGADAYIVKGAWDREAMISTVRKVL